MATSSEAVALILLHVADHETEVRRDESLGGGFIALLGESGETSLFSGVGDQWQLLDVREVLVERGRG
jgi:hypothetical protein